LSEPKKVMVVKRAMEFLRLQLA